MVTLGTGVGGGIIIDGKPLVGAHGAGGEIGHLCVNYEETDHCGCGNTGCLEQYASATGITRLANIRLAKDDKASVLRLSLIHISEPTRRTPISYAVFCLKKKKRKKHNSSVALCDTSYEYV